MRLSRGMHVTSVAVAVGVCAWMLLPMLWAATSALKPLEETYAFPPTFRVESPQPGNFVEAFRRLPMARFLLNSTWIAGVSAIGAVLTSAMAGYALARFEFRGRRIVGACVLAALLVPSQILIVPRFLQFEWLGWLGTYKPLIVPAWLGGGAFNVLLFRQFFVATPREAEDAARLDGAGPWTVFLRVALPSARPAVVTAGFLSFVFHWQEFLDPLLYLTDFKTFPVSLGLRMFQTLAGTWANLLMAASVAAMLPLVLLFLAIERDLMRGLGVLTSARRGRGTCDPD
ncbi:MAG: hypothetical protein FLDDKLPJ_02760 [Phycisphaerae bacterium]|nr:hypothetical protein [Phycisphaerae bacterium]